MTDARLNFSFLVKWRGDYVASVAGAEGLEQWDGVHYGPVSLERGIVVDADFARWMRAAADVPQDVQVEMKDEQGEVTLRWHLRGCRPCGCTQLDHKSADGEVAIASLTLEHEGWEQDKTVAEAAPRDSRW
jgi:hypothetical protein